MTLKIGPFTINRRSQTTGEEELAQLRKLYIAALKDDLPALRALFSQGLDFQLRDDKNRTLLHVAHRADTINFLIECGCDPLAVDEEQSTTLMHPGLDRNANQILLAQGVDVHTRDRHGNTALYRQCDFSGIGWDNPDLAALQVLLEAGVTHGNQAEVDVILANAAACVTSGRENNDVAILEHFLRRYQSAT